MLHLLQLLLQLLGVMVLLLETLLFDGAFVVVAISTLAVVAVAIVNAVVAILKVVIVGG